ncbi:MAG: class I SAM-dependent methyltransferase [Gammaproteobacteria bacterium]|nr:class I SAM-dependent methyltransferase [Gammaproteobacteria bacterium]
MSFYRVSSKLAGEVKKKEITLIHRYSSNKSIDHALLITERPSTEWINECACTNRHVLTNHYSREDRHNVNYYLGTLTHLPYSKESMDMIILLHVLENSTTPKELIQKSSAVLSQGGSMIIFVFSRLLSREKVKQHLKEAELEVIQFGSLAGPLYAFSENKMLSLIDKTLSIALPFLSQAFFIIAKKTTVPTNIIPTRHSLAQKFIVPLPSQCATQAEGPSI